MSTAAGEAKKTRTPGPTTVARAYFKAINDRDLDAAADMWKPGGIDRLVGMHDLRVPGDFKQWFGALLAAFPDFEFEVLTVAATKENVAVRWRARATFNGTGRFEGMKPTGAKVELEGCDMLTVVDGKITENHAYMNGTDLARQLGMMPPMGSPAEKAMLGAFNAKTSAKEAVQRFRER